MIETNEKMRDLYAKHLSKLYDYADGNFGDGECHMCVAARAKTGRDFTGREECNVCPISEKFSGVFCTDNRFKNLRSVANRKIDNYDCATPDSIRKHARWIEKQIVKQTDCEFEWKGE